MPETLYRKHLLGIGLVELLFVCIANRQIVRDLHFFRYELIRIIHRVEHAIDAQHRLTIENRRLPGHAAGGDVDVFLDVVARLLLQLLNGCVAIGFHHGAMHEVDAEKPIGKTLAQMSYDDAELREPIEDTADDDAQQVQTGFHGEAEDGAVQATLDKRADHRFRRRCGMNIDRNIQMLSGFEDWPEFGIVQVFATRVAVDDGAFQSELPDAALQFLGCSCRVLRSYRGQTRKPIRVLSNGVRQLIVEGSRERRGLRRVENLHAGSGERKDLHRDAAVIHVAETPFAQVLNALCQGGGARACARIEPPQTAESWIVIAVVQKFAVARY